MGYNKEIRDKRSAFQSVSAFLSVSDWHRFDNPGCKYICQQICFSLFICVMFKFDFSDRSSNSNSCALFETRSGATC